MKTFSLTLDDELDALLEAVSAEKGRSKIEVLTEVVRRYAETEKLKRSLQNPKLAELYSELAAEDLKLAEEGMADYSQILEKADEM